MAGLERALTLAAGVALVGAVAAFWLLRPRRGAEVAEPAYESGGSYG